ncbi:MAG TPA: hypothetical protein VM430_13960, partial [Microbacterium sp.]|nr:hypothetical protein [Microbacterium sp.]
MKLAIYVMHVPGTREAELAKLLERVPSAGVVQDPERRGAWHTAKTCWDLGIGTGADWIVVLNDDAEPCEDFEGVVRAALASRSERDPVCFYTAHPKAGAVTCDWYTTHDDLVGVGCALSREAAADFLNWADANPKLVDFSDDGRINLWAMATGRLVYTTTPSLVDHQLPDESMVGTVEPHARRAVVGIDGANMALRWGSAATHLGRARSGNQWEMLHRLDRV